MDIDEENHELVTLFDKIVALDSSKHQEIIDGYQNILKSGIFRVFQLQHGAKTRV